MSKAKDKATKFMSQAVVSKASVNSAPSMIGIPLDTNLSKEEQSKLKSLIEDYAKPKSKRDKVSDLTQLGNLSREIKTINAQSVLLHGERILKARDLLKNYKDGCFTKWLFLVYGTRARPYCYLNYFLFHKSLKPSLKVSLERMPKSASYLLASRGGDMSVKEDILKNHSNEKQKKLVSIIKTNFPLDDKDKRKKDSLSKDLELLETVCNRLQRQKDKLSKQQSVKLKKLTRYLEDLIA